MGESAYLREHSALMEKVRPSNGGRVSLTRALSKLGYCSRTEAEKLIHSGRVRVDGRTIIDPGHWTLISKSQISIDGRPVKAQAKVYLALNKPRGLVTTRQDSAGRATVYSCIEGLGLPFVGPVGRLDKASEGLLLMTNDTRWANGILAPESGVRKTYHVQIDRQPNSDFLNKFCRGMTVCGEFMSAESVKILRVGQRNAWLEFCLTEGRNRQIRRMLGVADVNVLRLIRVAIGSIELGSLTKGEARLLTDSEVAKLKIHRKIA